MSHSPFTRDEFSGTTGLRYAANHHSYELAGKIGNGAIGLVRKARDLETGNLVAVKFLAPEPKYIEESSFDDIYFRFRREGLRGAELTHDNLVRILAYEENRDGSTFEGGYGPANPFIVMEYINGTTLEHFLQKRTQAEMADTFNITRTTLHIAHSIANALLYLHRRKIVHRDVKPANIFFSRPIGDALPSMVKLGDFGVVKWGDYKATMTTGTLTMTGQQGLGTAKYMPPEQATKPKEVSIRSDMYALGVTLFELFTGHILPSYHHVYNIVLQRTQRGNAVSRLYDLGLGVLPPRYEDLFEGIYDMLAISPDVRPSSQLMEGKLRRLLDTYADTHN